MQGSGQHACQLQRPLHRLQPAHVWSGEQIRKIIAKRLLESKQTVPHLYLRADADLDPVSSMRESMKLQGTKVGSSASPLHCSSHGIDWPVL